jgi:hypothetical protein
MQVKLPQLPRSFTMPVRATPMDRQDIRDVMDLLKGFKVEDLIVGLSKDVPGVTEYLRLWILRSKGLKTDEAGGGGAGGSQCPDCKIVIDRDAINDASRCLDTPANNKFAKAPNGMCKRCNKPEGSHFHGRTFCNKTPYRLRLGSIKCCNCWFAGDDDDVRASFEKHACNYCKNRRAKENNGTFEGILHVTGFHPTAASSAVACMCTRSLP